jgi:hypothetical protein
VRALREKRTVRGLRGRWDLYVSDAESGSSALHIEAVNYEDPAQERLLWTTTPTCLEGVLDEIEEGLVAGKIVQPFGAVYSGAQDDDEDEEPPRAHGFVMPDVPTYALEPLREKTMDAYELLEKCPRGRSRRAAWNAYALHLYGDELLGAAKAPRFVSQDTAEMAGRLFQLAARWLDEVYDPASPGSLPELELPDWITPTRSQEQLAGMRETLDSLRTWLAYELEHGEPPFDPGESFDHRLAGVDRHLEEASLLWIDRQPAELRRGIGYTLTVGLERAYRLGQEMARAGVSTHA